MRFLVDSGSVVSLLPRSAVTHGLTVQPLLLAAANQSPIRTYGRRMLTLDLGLRRALSWPFIIADVHHAILGADFLIHSGLLIDMQHRRLVDSCTTLCISGEVCAAAVHSVAAHGLTDGEMQARRGYDELLVEFEGITRPGGQHATLQGETVQHAIHTTGPPIYERPRRLYGERLHAAQDFFRDLQDRGIVRPSSSQWASPLHMVDRKEGGHRATGDYRRLNAVTQPDRYPIPVIEDIFHECHGASIFSTVDLEKAFYQVPMAKADICKTAITTPFGMYEFLRMPLGLRNATQTFQRFMDALLRELPFAHCYLDDIIVASHSHEEHLQHLRTLFQILQRAGLSIKLGKCVFGRSEVDFLGHTISSKGFRPPQRKVEAIAKYPRPTDSTGLRRFLGMINHYRRSIPRAAHLQAPLNRLLAGKGSTRRFNIDWPPAAEEAFLACKQAIKDAVTNAFLSPTAPLRVESDASSTDIGAALEQLQHGVWEPISLFSRELSSAERKYSTYDRELLAAFAAVKFFRRFLEGRSFTLRTDHKPLTFAGQQPSHKASPRQQRQLDYLLQHNVDFAYIKGEENVVADALSRSCAISMPSGLLAADIQAAQQQDEELPHLLEAGALNLQTLNVDGAQIACGTDDGIVKPYLPDSMRRQAFDALHSPAHPSPRATVRLLAQKFTWPGIKKDAYRWARCCEPCQRAKVGRHNRAALSSFDVPDNRFEHLHMDIIILPQVDNYRYCLTMIDRFTRWPVAVPMTNIRAETVAAALLENWISQFGCPLTITTDQGTQFESALFKELARLAGAKQIHTTPYHPQANGIVERLHRTLKAALMCEPHTLWPQRLPVTLLGLRCCWKEDLQASPAEMLYGTTLRLPGEFFVSESIPADPRAFVGKLRSLFQQIRAVPASMHAKYRAFQHDQLDTCTHVFLRNDAVRKPLQPPYTGPHEVMERISNKVYKIKVNGTERTVSTDGLKPAYLDAADELPERRQPPQNVSPPATDHFAAQQGRPPSPQPVEQATASQPVEQATALLPVEQPTSSQPVEQANAPQSTQQTTATQPSSKPALPNLLRKRVSFPSTPAKVTEGGVPVGTPMVRSSATQRQRKQRLQQRHWDGDTKEASVIALSGLDRRAMHTRLISSH